MAVARMIEKFAGALPVRTLEASSLKTTSLTQRLALLGFAEGLASQDSEDDFQSPSDPEYHQQILPLSVANY